MKVFEFPVIEILVFKTEDVIATSLGENQTPTMPGTN